MQYTLKRVIWFLIGPLPYAAAFIVLYAVGALVTGGFIELVNEVAPAAPIGNILYLLVNVLPVSVISAGLYLPLAAFVHKFMVRTRGLLGHLQRCSVLYGVVGLAIWELISARDHRDYFMMSQILLWAALVGGAGIVSDLLVVPLRRLYDRAVRRAV